MRNGVINKIFSFAIIISFVLFSFSFTSCSQRFGILSNNDYNGEIHSPFYIQKPFQNTKTLKKSEGKKFHLWLADAEKGNAIAQYNLALLYVNGYGVDKNDAKAFKLFSKAAEAGVPQAQRNLGFCYRSGSGVAQDDSKAFLWFRKSALNGLADGQFCLAFCYAHGIGVKKDQFEAVKWFQESALNGLPDAQYILGLRYKIGSGVDKDIVEAFAFFNLASDKHDVARRKRIQLAKEMTKEQIAHGKRRTKELQEQIKAFLPRS